MCIFNWQGKILFLSLKISNFCVFVFCKNLLSYFTFAMQIEYISPCTSLIEGEKLLLN